MAHMVSAFASHNGQVLAQLKTEGKGGELAAIRQLLGLIDLRGATVTIDAIGCQKDIARQIVEGGGHYILQVKDNQKALHRRIQVEMDDLIRIRFKGVWHDRHQTEPEPGHGRIETRRVWVTDQLRANAYGPGGTRDGCGSRLPGIAGGGTKRRFWSCD